MKNLLYVLPIIGVLFLTSCDREESTEIAPEEAIVQELDQTVPKQTLVAKIQKDGHEFQFFKVGADNNIAIVQKLNELESNVTSVILENEESTPFDVFVSLTNPDVKVPQSIANTAINNALISSGRSTTHQTDPLIVLEPGFNTLKSAACYDVGATQFRNKYCDAPVSSTATRIEFCDSQKWNTLIRNSVFGGKWKKMDDTLAWTNVICGLTRLQIYGNDVLEYQVDFTNGIWYVKWYNKGTKRRQVKRFRPNNTGKFRAYTKFF
ncbi:hypothetical protein D1816_16635 [Aquimarina sp. AD10]|uniref:Lipoprotein n=1 Tax=Aquimarina aggregata TaxID=1642818 RepID=A0A162Z6N5_9FLAO|nr:MULTISPECIES: hypothetical protein [Aquimarina]AXT61912.1 hypothetical protein D1816_16635 [Aquimarina sp. AD10]KZS39587.1 hypothetical protein AWE51_08010 [Aquimarina aggregata]RKN02372.1 hypothetical protein D7033_00750 [Aquimarina sp. AD10]